MPIFNSLDSLYYYTNTVTMKKIEDKISTVAEEELDRAVEEELYNDVSHNDFYENTFGLSGMATATTTKYGNGVINTGRLIEVGIEPRGKYPSWYPNQGNNGTDNSENIVGWLNDGHKGYYKGVAIQYEGKKFVEKAQARLTSGGKLKKLVSEMLKDAMYKLGYGTSLE